MKEKSEENEKEMERILSDIQKDWKLTGDLIKDFTRVAIQEFNQENDFKQDLNDQILDDFSKELLKKIYGGMDYFLGKLGVSHVDLILKRWIEQSIDKEVHRRIEGCRKQSTDRKCTNTPQNQKATTSEGGMMYA